MKQKVCISSEKFDQVDFTESYLIFNCLPKLPDTFSFQAWGVVSDIDFLKNLRDPTENTFSAEHDVYIAGISTITITGVLGGKLSVELFDPVPSRGRYLEKDGRQILLERNWDYQRSKDQYDYEWHSFLDWPPGRVYLTLSATGEVTLEFDDEDIIPLKDFIINTNKYQFNKSKYNI